MNYQHIYHAGNFADVFKHAVLVALTQSFFQKEKPIFYLDTHAGAALYNLKSTAAEKTKDYESGISKIYLTKDELPAVLQNYLAIVKKFNKKFKFKPGFYPGSPYIVRELLRADDSMHLIEYNEAVYTNTKKLFATDEQVSVHFQDGYQALNALLPPAQRRGFVLIDPPYEDPKETKAIIASLEIALKKWATGVYAVWYPRKNQHENTVFLKQVKKAFPMNEILVAELDVTSMASSLALNGSGMLIINPPWQLDEKIKSFLPWLWRNLAVENAGGYEIKFL